MQYELLWSTTPYGLSSKVNEALRAGWTLQGGASVFSANMSATALYGQAIVKETEDNRSR